MVCRRYRPRQPRASPVWQVFRQHWPAYLVREQAGASANSGPLPPHVPAAVTTFLRCGNLHAGFTRFREFATFYVLALPRLLRLALRRDRSAMFALRLNTVRYNRMAVLYAQALIRGSRKSGHTSNR